MTTGIHLRVRDEGLRRVDGAEPRTAPRAMAEAEAARQTSRSPIRRVGVAFFGAALSLYGAACGSDSDSELLPGVSALVFAKRAYVRPDGTHDVAGGAGQTMEYARYVPGGGLFVLDPPTPSGRLTNLTASFEGVDVGGVDLSFDARQAVFSMRHAGDDRYHLYVTGLDGTGLRQLTFGEHDDVKPLYVPGDRIAFVTNQSYTAMGTRADEYNHGRAVTQIATVSLELGDADRRVCSQNLSHTVDPFLLADGRVGFSRWEHLGPVNDLKLFAMNPDCTQMVALAGQHGKPTNSLVQVNELEPGVFIGVGTSRDGTIQAGTLLKIDARSTHGTTALRLDEQSARIETLTPQVPVGMESPPSGVGRYRSPRGLPGTASLLVSWADGDVNERNELSGTAPNFGIYLWDPATRRRTLVYDDPSMWDLYAMPAVARAVPPVHPGTVAPAPDPSTPAVLGSVDITVTSLEEQVNTVDGGFLDGVSLADALREVKRVRIIEGFSSEIGGVREFGLTMHEGAAIVGEAPVYPDGSWEARVPALVPYHLQPIDEFGLAVRNQLLWIQAMPGEQRRCGGCHEGRADTIQPRGGGATTLAQQAGASDFVFPIPDRLELPWAGSATATNVQNLFDAKCVSCHSGGDSDPFAGRFYTVVTTMEDGEVLEQQVPYLDLSSRPLDVFYENEVHAYPASYATLLYPSAMMGDSEAMGDVAPEWVVPGSARRSPLVRKVNAQSEGDASRWAWPSMPHPEDVTGGAVSLTREERLMLIRMADLGGQYWTRKNVESANEWNGVEY